MTPEEYQLLFDKFLNGQASADEVDALMQYNDGFNLKRLDPPEQLENRQEIEARLKRKLYAGMYGRQANRKINVWRPAAAAVVVLLVAGLFYLKRYHQDLPARLIAGRQVIKYDVVPGSSKAVLILGNGRQIVLNDSVNGTLVKQGNTVIRKEQKGILQYDAAAAPNAKPVETGMNTISIPKGGQYQVVLPDGTRVWLNASSTLTFPPEFKGKERRVQLSGEAYFEVAKNKDMPFRVTFNKEEVEVLGTHFNIMAYGDEATSQTTLLEGSVKIRNGQANKLLTPGQQAIGSVNEELRVQPARIEEVIAWKDGYFFFKDKSIRFIMRQVARWYDVDVVYQGNLQDQVFGGRISRYKNISELLNKLELTGTIHFKIEGKQVTVLE